MDEQKKDKKTLSVKEQITKLKQSEIAKNKHAVQKTQFNSFLNKIQRLLFSSREQQAFLEDWTSLVEDGVAPVKALETLRQICNKSAVQVADSIMEAAVAGHPLADGMRGWFPPTVIELIHAGEEGGSFMQTMRSATESMQTKNSAVGSIIGVLSYPVVVLILGLYVTVYINNSILTQFAAILPISQWPQDGKNLVAFANLVEHWWWALLVIIVGGSIGLYQFLFRYIGEYREYVDKIPLLSLYRRISAARFMETLGLLTSNGVVFKKALSIMQQGASPYSGWHLMLMERRLGRGQSNIADVLDTGMVEQYDVLRLKAIAQGHGFEEALVRQGKLAAERSNKLIQMTSKILSGMLLGLGTVLAAFIITSIYSVGSHLGSSLQGMGGGV
ncbi:MAG: tcpE [Gammaproteobacteria bacterium]|jgi:type II secretory pathway component PulF|nr:tcpE [Gammaproteobacteria bacterium]